MGRIDDGDEAIAAWRDNGWDDLSPKTARHYESIWRVHIEGSIGRHKIATLTTYDVERFYRSLKAQGSSQPLVRHVKAVLHRSCRLAQKWSGGRLQNPAADADLPVWRLEERPAAVRAPELAEVQALIRAAEAEDIRMGTFLRLLAATGLRRGEACALRWGDIDLDAGFLTVDESIIEAKGSALVKAPKTKVSIRKVSCDPRTLGALRELQLEQERLAFHTPGALSELLSRDPEAEFARLYELPWHHQLRPYQVEADTAIEQAIAARRRTMLVTMATGTGKTLTLVAEAYRLMKSGVARRVLSLVDRKALAAQAVRAFASFEAEPGLKFDEIYPVYSQRFQRDDLADEGTSDPTVMPNSLLTSPKLGDAFVYICTIQRMTTNLLGRDAVLSFGPAEDSVDEDAGKLDIPIHAFDLVIADECHRGYSSKELSVWRSTLDHFDAVKVGLTATPAAHTMAYFENWPTATTTSGRRARATWSTTTSSASSPTSACTSKRSTRQLFPGMLCPFPGRPPGGVTSIAQLVRPGSRAHQSPRPRRQLAGVRHVPTWPASPCLQAAGVGKRTMFWNSSMMQETGVLLSGGRLPRALTAFQRPEKSNAPKR